LNHFITMDKNRTIEILEALASGCSPKTGEMTSDESILNERDVIRALQFAIDELKKESKNNIVKEKKLKDEGYKKIDYFQQEKFNNISDSAINRIKELVKSFGILKTDNLSESIINARVVYPRAYESWSLEEKELLNKAIKLTNDLDILSECFQRGKGSIETYGQKLIYESQLESK
jgi:hypothetical protein